MNEKTQPMTIQLGAIYREKATGRIMELSSACSRDGLTLRPAGKLWHGAAQDFDEQFETVSEYEPDEQAEADRFAAKLREG